MTTLFGKKTGYYIKEEPILKSKINYAILYYGDILNQKDWNILKVPISSIKSIIPSYNGYDKIKVIWNNDKEELINMFNKIEFI